MGIATAKFSDGIYFTNQKGRREKNDFYINFFVSGKLKDSTIKRDKCAHAYILGLERLFKNDASLGRTMENFAKAFNKNGNDGCEVSYIQSSPYGNALIVSFAGDIIKEMMSVTIQLSEKYEFTAEFQDKESIGITVHFDDFDQFYFDMNQTIEQGAIITAYETPYIEKLAINFDWENFKNVEMIEYEESHKNVVPNGEIGEISWDLGNVEKAEAYLCDEDGILLTNIPPYEIEIDRNRKFKLNVEKNGKTVSQLLEVKDAPYIEDFHVKCQNKDLLNNIIEYNEEAKITCNIRCTEDFISYLYFDKSIEPFIGKTKDYILPIRKDTKFTLKVEKEDVVVYQDLTIYRTLWSEYFSYSYSSIIPFKPVENGCNKLFYSNQFSKKKDGVKVGTTEVNFIYIHPWIYTFRDLLDNLEKDFFEKNENAPTEFINYSCFYDKDKNKEALTICYTCSDKIIITSYDISSGNWSTDITIQGDAKSDLELFGTITSCHYAHIPNTTKKILFVIYDSFIRIYKINQKDNQEAYLEVGAVTVSLPSTKIVSIDTSLDRDCQNLYLAVLCKDEQDQNHVYAYNLSNNISKFTSSNNNNISNSEIPVEIEYTTKKNNQTRVTLANSKNHEKPFIILNDGIYPIKNNDITNPEHDLMDENFSPYQTTTDKEKDFVLISSQFYGRDFIQAIVKNKNEITTWFYKDDI